jgi:signal peptidase I
MALLTVIGILLALASLFTPSRMTGATGVQLLLMAVQLVAPFLLLRWIFALSVKRTWVPFAAHLLIGIAEMALAVLVVRPMVLETFWLPTQSMSPTIEPGDRFSVVKILRPRRLDLVVYRPEGEKSEPYCKRIIAFGGERLRFAGGEIFVNDQKIHLPPVLAGRCSASPRGIQAEMARYHDGETIVLAADEFFVIGDNVDVSADSRMVGPSRAGTLVGVVDLIYWPMRKIRVVR